MVLVITVRSGGRFGSSVGEVGLLLLDEVL